MIPGSINLGRVEHATVVPLERGRARCMCGWAAEAEAVPEVSIAAAEQHLADVRGGKGKQCVWRAGGSS